MNAAQNLLLTLAASPTRGPGHVPDLRWHEMKKTPTQLAGFQWRRRELKTPQAILREPTFIDFYGVGWKRRYGSKWRMVTQFDGATQGAA